MPLQLQGPNKLMGPLQGGLRGPLPTDADTLNTEDDIIRTAKAVSAKYGVDPRVILGIIKAESGFNKNAIGPVTSEGWRAVGLMQLSPAAAARWGVNPRNPYQNILGGVQEFAGLMAEYKGNTKRALAAYNAGDGAVARGAENWSSVQQYVNTVLSYAGSVPATATAPQQRLQPQAPQRLGALPGQSPRVVPWWEQLGLQLKGTGEAIGAVLTKGGPILQTAVEHPQQSLQALAAGATFDKLVKPPEGNSDIESLTYKLLDAAGQTPWWAAADAIAGVLTAGIGDIPLLGAQAGRVATIARASAGGAIGGYGTSRLAGETHEQALQNLTSSAVMFGGMAGAGRLLNDAVIGRMLRRIAPAYGQSPEKFATSVAARAEEKLNKMGLRVPWQPRTAPEYVRRAEAAVPSTLDWATRVKAGWLKPDSSVAAEQLLNNVTVASELNDVFGQHVTQRYQGILMHNIEEADLNRAAREIEGLNLKDPKQVRLIRQRAEAQFQMGPEAMRQYGYIDRAAKLLRAYEDDSFAVGLARKLFTPEQYVNDHLMHTFWEAVPGSKFYTLEKANQIRQLAREFSRRSKFTFTAATTRPRVLDSIDAFQGYLRERGLNYHAVDNPFVASALNRRQIIDAIGRDAAWDAIQKIVEPVRASIAQIQQAGGGWSMKYAGWRATNIAEFGGTHFPAVVAEALDKFVPRIRGLESDPRSLAIFNRLVRNMIIVLPFRHSVNIMTRASLALGAKAGLAPSLNSAALLLGGWEGAMPKMATAFGQHAYDAVTNGPMTRIAAAAGVRMDWGSVWQSNARATEHLVDMFSANTPELESAARRLAAGEKLRASAQVGGVKGLWDVGQAYSELAGQFARDKLESAHILNSPLWQAEQKWLWDYLDKGLRNWILHSKLSELLGEETANHISAGRIVAKDVDKLLAERRFSSSLFGVRDVTREGLTKGKGIRLEEIGNYVNTIMTDYTRELQNLPIDKLLQNWTMFYSWRRGIWTMYGHIAKHIIDTGPEGAWARQAAARAIVASTIVYPALASYLVGKATGRAAVSTPMQPTQSPVVGGYSQPAPTMRNPMAEQPRDIRMTLPGGIGEPLEVAERITELYPDPLKGMKRLASFAVAKAQPATRAALTLAAGGVDPITRQQVFGKTGNGWGDFLKNTVQYAGGDFAGIFSVFFNNDPEAVKVLRFLGAPIYTSKTAMPTLQEIENDIINGNFSDAMKKNEVRIGAGQSTVTPSEVGRRIRDEMLKLLGIKP